MNLILKDLHYTTVEHGSWHRLALTPNELTLIKEYVSELEVPNPEGSVKLPVHLNFLPHIYVHAINVNGEIWDCINGWREKR